MEELLKTVVPIVTILFGSGIYWKLRENRHRKKDNEGKEEDKTERVQLKNGKLIQRIQIPVGSFVEVYDYGRVCCKITCHQLVNANVAREFAMGEEERLTADMEFISRGTVYEPSQYVLRSAVNRFYMPANDHEPAIIYKLYHSERKVYSFMAYVTHIDTKAEVVYVQLAIAE